MERRFLRKSNDKVVGGVCSGLAQYVGADIILVRLISLFGILASGIFPGLFLYLICLIIVPLDSHVRGVNNPNSGPENFDYSSHDQYNDNRSYEPPSNNSRYVIGIGLIGIGVFLFARLFFSWLKWEYVFAGLLIVGGLVIMVSSNRRNS